MALSSGQENYIPESFMVTSKFRRKRFSVRGDSSQGAPTLPGNCTQPWSAPLPSLPSLSGEHGAPCSEPPSGTTCLKKARQDVVWLGQALGSQTQTSPLFFTQTPRHRISSLCWFSWEKPGGPRGSMTTNETLLPPWQAKQVAKS